MERLVSELIESYTAQFCAGGGRFSTTIDSKIRQRLDFYHSLRNAGSWDEVFNLTASHGYRASDVSSFIASDSETGESFSLWECGHSRLVFEERLGPCPDVISR